MNDAFRLLTAGATAPLLLTACVSAQSLTASPAAAPVAQPVSAAASEPASSKYDDYLEGLRQRGFDEVGNPLDRSLYPRVVPKWDPDFVLQVMEMPEPPKRLWKRVYELYMSHPQSFEKTFSDHLRNKPKPSAEEIQGLIAKTRSNLMFIEGGRFWMGDFGSQTPSRLPMSSSERDDPGHPVTLSSYSISKYRVSFAELDLYTRAMGLTPVMVDINTSLLNERLPGYQAISLPWKTARGYCQWLGKQMNLPMDLPTEAQWEYAARSRGKLYYFGIAEEDPARVEPIRLGNEFGKRAEDREIMDEFSAFPPGTYGPNPIGLYDMLGYGREWVYDWYGPYSEKPLKDPRGPATGTERVVRNSASGVDSGTTDREGRDPENLDAVSFRCAVNSTKPVKPTP